MSVSVPPFRTALSTSTLIHFALAASLGGVYWAGQGPDTIEFEIYDFPAQTKPSSTVPKPITPKAKPKEKTVPKKAVFGRTRNAIETQSEEGIQAKVGNTVAKESDDKVLKDDDPDRLPIPKEEYLVTQMPQLKREVRIPYPTQARERGIQGPVEMNLLIDQKGRVRDVQVISGPGFGLNEAAAKAARGFEFVPARVEDQNVAVKIRYVYRFVLEN